MQTFAPLRMKTWRPNDYLGVERVASETDVFCSVGVGSRPLTCRSSVESLADWRKGSPLAMRARIERRPELGSRCFRSQRAFATADVHGSLQAPFAHEASRASERDGSFRNSQGSASSRTLESPAAQKPAVMVNSLTGKMGLAVAKAAVAAGLPLVPYSIIGESDKDDGSVDADGLLVKLRYTAKREALLDEVLSKYSDVIIVDFTIPPCVNDNAEFYCKRQVPFVMGTTGGDRVKLMDDVLKSGNYAVIAPQMGKQVVAFQAAMHIMADQFPGAFSGYKLKVTESHQSSKLDTSGTAKAIVGSFKKLGLEFDFNKIEMVRDRDQQVQRMNVPEEHLLGHAFHTYQVVSPDNTVAFEFQHNVCGRSIYAEGTVDAVLFLARKIAQKAEKKVYDMIDVLREGNMR